MVRNGFRSQKGRSAIARKVRFGGASGTNGIMPRVYVITTTGEVVKTNYFGGPKKGGAAPSATGFMIAKSTSQAFQPAAPALRPNYLFRFRQFYTLGNPRSGGPML
jgi:hypothetical protein